MLRKFSSQSQGKVVQVIDLPLNKKRLRTPPRDDDTNNTNPNKDDSKDHKSNDSDIDDIVEYVDVNKQNGLYFEKQQWEMCLLHALNALYQKPKFSMKTLDDLCQKLAPDKLINPHKSIFQTGNYDANVLMMALEEDGVDVQWFDSRKASSELHLIDTFLCPKDEYSEFKGFILNNPHKRMIVFSRRHWLTVKRIGNVWYNLDSRNKEPQKYQTAKEIQRLEDWLIDVCRNNDAQLMICRIKKKETKH